MIPETPETVTAIYELPVPIWVTCAALGSTHPSGYGRVQFDVVMPQDRAPVGGPPAIDGVEVPGPTAGKLVEWTTRYAGWIPKELEPATALRRIVITNVKAPTDPDKAWRGSDQQLGEAISYWFNQVRTWAEIFTGQDLDPAHRIFDANTVGAGLIFTPPRDSTLGFQLTTRHIRPVTADQWQGILAAVRDGKEPPLDYLLARDANAAFARGFYRRAVIDAAAVVELTLAQILDERIEDLPAAQRKRMEGATLGRYIDIARASGFEFGVTYEDLKRLSQTRNDAVHRAQDPGYPDTADLMRVAAEFRDSPVRTSDTSAGTN